MKAEINEESFYNKLGSDDPWACRVAEKAIELAEVAGVLRTVQQALKDITGIPSTSIGKAIHTVESHINWLGEECI